MQCNAIVGAFALSVGNPLLGTVEEASEGEWGEVMLVARNSGDSSFTAVRHFFAQHDERLTHQRGVGTGRASQQLVQESGEPVSSGGH
jgi:hypothetical protein